MSLKHFIAAPYEIPVGEFGTKPSIIRASDLKKNKKGKKQDRKRFNVEEQHVIHYEKGEDFYGLFITELDSDFKKVLQTKFSNPYIYEFEGYFYNTQNANHQSAIYSLFEYINNYLTEGKFIEIYSCWDGQEQDDRNEKLDTTIHMSRCQFGKHLNFSSLKELSLMIQLEERQYIIVEK